MYKLLRFVPKNHLSYFLGKMVHVPLPKFMAAPLIRWFAGAYKIDVDEAAHPIENYPSIGAFFTRDLKEGKRPIEGDLVSPVDATLRNFGVVTGGVLEQIKGRDYSVATFLGSEELAHRFEGGTYFNFYLSPQDYHHIHSPVSGNVVRCVHVPGRLWPVNDWSIANVESLFAVNERVLTLIESNYGDVALVMVGATNVGKMTVTYDALTSNNLNTRVHDVREYNPGRPLQVGARLGTFHMGSSVVVLFEKGKIDLTKVAFATPSKVKLGQALLK